MSAAPCPTSGARHAWSFVKNVSVGKFRVTQRGTSGTFTLKGLYRCACGAKKHGNPDHNGTDLRTELHSAGFSGGATP